MRQCVFTIFDDKAKAFLPPFYMPLKPMALRTFTNCVNDPTHAFCANPEDYTLFYLGIFDNESGRLELLETHEVVCNGVQVKKVQE